MSDNFGIEIPWVDYTPTVTDTSVWPYTPGTPWSNTLATGEGGMGQGTLAEIVQAASNAGASGSSLLQALAANPGLLGAIAGMAGPVGGLIGNLASGGQTGSQNQTNTGNLSGYNNQDLTGVTNTNQTGFSNQTGGATQNQTGTSNQTGYSNTTGTSNQSQTPTLDPRASSAADRLTSLLSGGFGGSAEGMYNDALSLMRSLALQGGGATAARPNTSPTPAAVTGFPDQLPTTIDPALAALVKQANQTMVGDIASQAITGARERGFAGGASLLNEAASPVASGALAAVPAAEAKQLLDMMLNSYIAQGNVAAQRAAAQAGALNAATNALGPGVQAYGAELNAGNQRIANQASLLQAMMSPQQQLINANLGLMNALPHGTNISGTQTNNTISGQSGTNSLSGVTSNVSNTNTGQTGTQNTGQSSRQNTGQQSNTNITGNQSIPLGQVIGTGIGNLIGGGATGYAAGTGNTNIGNSLNPNASLLAALRSVPNNPNRPRD